MNKKEKHFLVRAIEAAFAAAFVTLVFLGVASHATVTKPTPSVTITRPVMMSTGPNAGKTTLWQLGKSVSIAWRERAVAAATKVKFTITDNTGNTFDIGEYSARVINYQNGTITPLTSKSFILRPTSAAGTALVTDNTTFKLSIQLLDKNGGEVASNTSNASIIIGNPNTSTTVATPKITISAPTANQKITVDKNFRISFTANFPQTNGFNINIGKISTDPNATALPTYNIASSLSTTKGSFTHMYKIPSSAGLTAGSYTLQIYGSDSNGNTVSQVVTPITLSVK